MNRFPQAGPTASLASSILLFYTYEDPLCLFLYAQDGTILIHRFCIALAGRDILLARVAWRSLACSPRSRVSLALRGFLLEFMRSSLAPLPWSERILVPAQLAGVARVVRMNLHSCIARSHCSHGPLGP